MATNSSPIQGEFKELFRHGEGDGEEDDDGDEMLDPRVKVGCETINVYILRLRVHKHRSLPVYSVFLFFYPGGIRPP